MSWQPTIEQIRVRIGLQPDDASRDADITQALEITLQLVETYLDRKLLLDTQTEDFVGYHQYLLVKRWPIQVGSIKMFSENQLVIFGENYVDYENGIISGGSYGQKVTLEYQGGYDLLPADLLWAMLGAFDALWAATPGLGATGGGGLITGTGAVKKVSLVGIGSVDLDVGVTQASSGSSSAGAEPWSIFPAAVMAILDRYRRESVLGAG